MRRQPYYFITCVPLPLLSIYISECALILLWKRSFLSSSHWPLRRTECVWLLCLEFTMLKGWLTSMQQLEGGLTLVLLAANTKWCEKAEKWLKPWHLGTHLRVLRQRAIKWTPTWQGLGGFQKSLHMYALGESSLSIERVKYYAGDTGQGFIVLKSLINWPKYCTASNY